MLLPFVGPFATRVLLVHRHADCWHVPYCQHVSSFSRRRAAVPRVKEVFGTLVVLKVCELVRGGLRTQPRSYSPILSRWLVMWKTVLGPVILRDLTAIVAFPIEKSDYDELRSSVPCRPTGFAWWWRLRVGSALVNRPVPTPILAWSSSFRHRS